MTLTTRLRKPTHAFELIFRIGMDYFNNKTWSYAARSSNVSARSCSMDTDAQLYKYIYVRIFDQANLTNESRTSTTTVALTSRVRNTFSK